MAPTLLKKSEKVKMKKTRRTIKFVFCALATVMSIQANAQAPSTSLSDEFKSGNLRLERSLMGSGVSGTAELKQMYDNKRWEDLVKGVVSKRFVVDTYYFYLGAAAEESGYPEAAYRYYELAAKTSEKCSGYQTWTDTCVGFKFPGDALARMEGLSHAMKGEEQQWLPGKGPTLSELVGLTAISLENVQKIKSERLVVRDKFETDEQYQARVDKANKGFLVISSLDVGDSSSCDTTYDHAAGEYKISKCLALVGTAPLHRNIGSDTVRLANMVDSRDVKRTVKAAYYIGASIPWSQTIKISPEEARHLEHDLMVGIVSKEFTVDRNCYSCDRRSATWKKEAFLDGYTSEDWSYTIRPSKVERFVVYRRSDSRVLYSLLRSN